MKGRLAILFLILFSFNAVSGGIERRIIIEDGMYYYTTIHDETQLATLFTGSIEDSMSKAEGYQLPAGNNITDDFNPFAWDIAGGFIFAISFFDHPLNDRVESIKRITLDGLDQFNGKPAIEIIMHAVDNNMMVMNEPYLNTISRSNILQNFYFDCTVINDTSFYIAFSNNSQFQLWRYDGEEWHDYALIDHPILSYFSLIDLNDQLYLVTGSGQVILLNEGNFEYLAMEDKIGVLHEHVLIEDRDNKRVLAVPRKKLKGKDILKDVLEKHSKTIL